MEQYLIDTNVICDYLSNAIPADGQKFMDAVVNAIPNISVITQIELLCWNTNEITKQNIRNFITECNIYAISNEVIEHCVIIRKLKKIKTPDAIIAATALCNNFTILSRNISDFKNIKGLKHSNPWEL